MLLPSQLKEESLNVISLLLSKNFINRQKCIDMDWCGDGDGVEVPVQEIMIDSIVSFYKEVAHLGEKEAAGSVVLIPFLGQVIEALDVTLHRQHLLDAQFTVTRTESRGRNPFAIVQYVYALFLKIILHGIVPPCTLCVCWLVALYMCQKSISV